MIVIMIILILIFVLGFCFGNLYQLKNTEKINDDWCLLAQKVNDDWANYCETLIDEIKTLRLPCIIGDKVYVLFPKYQMIDECEVIGVIIGRNNDTLQFKDGSIYTIWDKNYNEHFGKRIFLTKKEAEKRLKELVK